jgi:hypothetical protein
MFPDCDSQRPICSDAPTRPEWASLFSFFGACVMFGWWLKSHQEAVAKVAKDGDFFSFHPIDTKVI